jgi:hypothetical protein
MKRKRQPKSEPRIVLIDMRPIAERYADDGSDSERRFFARLAIHNASILMTDIAKDTTGRGGVEADKATKRILGPSSKVSRP